MHKFIYNTSGYLYGSLLRSEYAVMYNLYMSRRPVQHVTFISYLTGEL